MTITSTNRTDLGYIVEVTPGITPATPAFQLLPTTGGAPTGNLATEVSKVIRSDRSTDDLIIVDSEVGGEINFELSFNPWKTLLDSLLQNDTPVTVAIAAVVDIGVTSGTGILDSGATDFVVENLAVGQWIRTSGFAQAGNNGFFRVLAVAAAALTLDDPNSVLVTEAAGASVSIDAETLVNGTDTPDSYSFVKRVQGITTTGYFYYRGCQISQVQLNFETGAILAATMTIMGLTEDPTETPIAGQAFTPIPAYELMNSASSVKRRELSATGLPVSRFERLSLTVNNNIEAAKEVGVLGAADLASFSLDVTGDIRVYFEDIDQYKLFTDSTSFVLSVLVEDAGGEAIGISLPFAKFEELDPPIEGKDNFLMLDGTVRGLRDPVTGVMVQLSYFTTP